MRTLKIIIAFIGLVLLEACITPLDVTTEETERILVVEGHITTDFGPHLIRLTGTARYGSIFEGVIRPEERAEIWITDNEGNVTFAENTTGGLYETPFNFRAEVGKSYILNVRTTDGRTYASTPELVVEVPAIDTLTTAFKKLPSTDPDRFRSGIEVFGTWQDPETETNFYLWKNSGTYLIETRPDLFSVPGPPRIPAPKDCCATCWIYEQGGDNNINIFKDNNTNGTLNTALMAFIEDNGERFTDRYYVEIEQLSISKGAYQFYDLLNNQLSIDGDVFDPPPATVRGNMINLQDPEASVIGYFFAADVKSRAIFLSRDMLEEFQLPRQVNDDCRTLPGATTFQPPFWE